MDESTTKIMYEISKLTNTSKQISSDFIETITLVMFRELVNTLPNKEKYVDVVLNAWEEQIVHQKKNELQNLVTQNSNLFELMAGSIVANSENLDAFIEEVKSIKKLYRDSLLIN